MVTQDKIHFLSTLYLDFNRSKSSGNNVLTNSSYQSDKRPSSVHSKPSSTPYERPAHRSSAKANTS